MEDMNYKNFVDMICSIMSEVRPEYEFGSEQIDKLQNASYLGMTMREPGEEMGVSVDLHPMFEAVQNGEDLQKLVYELAESISNAMEQRPQFSTTELSDYETMKDKLMIQLVPIAGNETMLAEAPHQCKEDMAIVYYLVLENSEDRSAVGLVTNRLMDRFGVTESQLHEDALISSADNFPGSLRSIEEMMMEMLDMDDMPPSESSMYVATCNNGIRGSGCIFQPGFMDEAAEKLGGNYYILPSSVHEVILVPEREAPSYQQLEELVQSVNAEEVRMEDRLSEHVYHYDARERVFETAEKFAGRSIRQERQSVSDVLRDGRKRAEAITADKKAPVRNVKEQER